MGICWHQVGLLKESQGMYEEAETPYKRALAIMSKAGNDMILADILDKLARLHMELEDEQKAIPLFERLLKIKKILLLVANNLNPTQTQPPTLIIKLFGQNTNTTCIFILIMSNPLITVKPGH